MAPTGWATPEERDFLKSFLPEYEACQVKRKYKAFWQRLNVDYFAKFPLLEKLLPGRPLTALTEDEKELYSAAMVKQQQRLKEWFRWQMNPRSRNAGSSITKKDLHLIYNGRTRGKKPYEVFAKLYANQVDTEKSSRCESLGIKGRQQLSVWHEVAKELYRSATDEQLEAVKREMGSTSETKGGLEATPEDVSGSPSTYLRYLKKLPALLDAAVSPAVRKAGVLALITVVGPDPEKGGRIMTRTLQFGDQPTTPVFSEVWAEHDGLYLEEVARFAGRHEFPPEVCAARALDPKGAGPDPSSNPGKQVFDSSAPSSLSALTVGPGPAKHLAREGSGGVESPTPARSSPVSKSTRVQTPQRHSPSPPSSKARFLTREQSGAQESDEDTDDEEREYSESRIDLSPQPASSFNWDFTPEQWESFDETLKAMEGLDDVLPRTARASPRFSPSGPTQTPTSPTSFNSMALASPPRLFLNTPESDRRQALLMRSPETSNIPVFNKAPGTNYGHWDSQRPGLDPSLPLTSESQFGGFFAPPQGQASLNKVTAPLFPDSNRTRPTSGNIHTHGDHLSCGSSQAHPPHLPPASLAPPSPPASTAPPPLTVSTAPPPPSVPRTTPSPPIIHKVQRTQNPRYATPPPLGVGPLKAALPPSISRKRQLPFTANPVESQNAQQTPSLRLLPGSPEPALVQESLPASPSNETPRPLPPPGPISNVSSQPDSLTEDSNRRCSGHVSVPSRRHEQLQMIGTNTTKVTQDTEKDKDPGDVAWFEASLEALRSQPLGEPFLAMVEKWEKLELTLGCGKVSKGSLPNASKRPKEWSKWTSKTWQGMRCYDKIPNIEDPSDIGIAITKWWSSFQPPFCTSTAAFPLPVYSDPEVDDADVADVWAHLRKSGPNGLVSMVMLLMWWGHAAETSTSEWQEDSRPAWKHMVSDFGLVLDEITRTFLSGASSASAKRPTGKENSERAAKRART